MLVATTVGKRPIFSERSNSFSRIPEIIFVPLKMPEYVLDNATIRMVVSIGINPPPDKIPVKVGAEGL